MSDSDFYGDFGDPYDPYAPADDGTGNDFRWKWVQYGRVFNFFVFPFEIETFEDGGANYSLPESESPGVSNTYQEDSYLKPRDITITGRVVADDCTGIRAAFDTLAGAFPEGSAGRLYRASDRYLNGRVGLFREAEADEGFNDRKWTLGIRCADPFYYSASAEDAVSLDVSGTGSTTALTPGGTAETLPDIVLVVPSGGVGKQITLSSPGNTLACIFTPPSAGTYILSSSEGTITRSGVDYLWAMDGDLLSLRHYATSITILLSESGILTSVSVQWTRRWRSG